MTSELARIICAHVFCLVSVGATHSGALIWIWIQGVCLAFPDTEVEMCGHTVL